MILSSNTYLDIQHYTALPHIKFLLGSLRLEWYVLKKAAPHMIKMAQQNEDIFTSNSVVFIQVDQYVVLDCRAKDETQIVSPRLYVIVLFTFSLVCHLHMLYCTARF